LLHHRLRDSNSLIGREEGSMFNGGGSGGGVMVGHIIVDLKTIKELLSEVLPELLYCSTDLLLHFI